ncbi:MAG: hypothetical protein DRQ46_00115 [Gammaproteobacteria bacterium]|nr:MAG: hypothetical protein DRQ46_00115 [Gammaproteobacteria bacterium]
MTEIKWTAEKVAGLLREKYSHPKWSTFSELRNSTGYGMRQRYFDFFAINTWPSEHIKVCYEIKVSRSDFLHELDNPKKRKDGMNLSNEFWFIAPKGCIKESEVPEGCGYMMATDGGMLKRIMAARYSETQPIDDVFLCSVLRAADNYEYSNAKIFKYAGKDLTEKELLKIVKSTFAKWQEYEIEDKVRERIKDIRKEYNDKQLSLKEDERYIAIGKEISQLLDTDTYYGYSKMIKEFFDNFGADKIESAIAHLQYAKDIVDKFKILKGDN